ncbi:MAG: aminotransferase class IV [Candidatus Omnitrophota bacterium]
MKTAYLNNKFIPLKEANVSILDRGFLYADGAFETMRASRGIVFQFEAHIKRLKDSLKALHINADIDSKKAGKIIAKLLKKNKLKEAYIKIIVTRGEASGVSILRHNKKPTIAVYALLHKKIPAKIYEKGFKLFISRSKMNAESPIAKRKTLNYLHNILCRYEAEKKGFDEAIFTNTKGFLTEATASNIFLVKNKKLFTPAVSSGILPGITRQEVMRLAKKYLGRKVNERLLKINDLYGADEVFLTNSTMGVMPVVKIGRRFLKTGKPGAITQCLIRHYNNSVREYSKKT